MNYDRQIVINNIRLICELNNVKLGQLEKEAGISIGYLSRLEHCEKVIPLNLVYVVSMVSGVSLDSIVKKDLREEYKAILNTFANEEQELSKQMSDIQDRLDVIKFKKSKMIREGFCSEKVDAK